MLSDNVKIVDGKITEFQYPDGWYMRIGQVYSCPYEPLHFLITRFEQDEFKDEVEDILVYYKQVDPKNYENVIVGKEEYCRAWYVNEGNWDLEQEGMITFENGSEIKIMPTEDSIRGKQREYVWGLDFTKEKED